MSAIGAVASKLRPTKSSQTVLSRIEAPLDNQLDRRHWQSRLGSTNSHLSEISVGDVGGARRGRLQTIRALVRCAKATCRSVDRDAFNEI